MHGTYVMIVIIIGSFYPAYVTFKLANNAEWLDDIDNKFGGLAFCSNCLKHIL
jgi:hypothetical protein